MICSSWSWPNMFDVSKNQISLYKDSKSITNRVKLMLLTEPTELYMNPTYGVGLKRYLFTYNTDNVIAQIRDKLVEQLKLWEPSVIADDTTVVRTNPKLEDADRPVLVSESLNTLELTVTLKTIYMQVVSFNVTGDDLANFI